jgi:hypothetical protein
MPEAVQFSRPASYAGRRQIEATFGPPADGHRLVIRAVPHHRGLWNVYAPGMAYMLRGEDRRQAEVLLLAVASLAEAKRFCAHWLGTPFLCALVAAEREDAS